MAETVLLAISQRDERRLAELVDTAADVVSADGTVVVLHAFEEDRYDEIAAELHLGPDAKSRPDELAQRHTVASDAAERLRERGIDVTVRGAIGENGTAILRVADDVDANMLIVGGRSRSPSGKALFGSTAQRVLLDADAPVTFVKEQASASTDAPAPTAD
jgi:nucleotide-binding universal stress UspA family protein